MNPTPQEALEMLDRAVGMLNASRADHFALQQAIMTLRRYVSEHENPPKAPDAS
jgi:hypothetical protein